MNKKTKITTSKNQVVELKQQGNIALQLLIKLQRQDESINLKELMSYPLMPVPSSIGTPDGYLPKTDKSKGFHYLTKGIENAEILDPSITMYIEDGNATFYNLKQSPTTFKEICEKIFDISTSGKKMSFLVLICIFHAQSNLKSEKEEAVGKAMKLSSENDSREVSKIEIPCLLSNQEETDTRVILYSFYAEEHGFQEVCVRSLDSDIFFILLHLSMYVSMRIKDVDEVRIKKKCGQISDKLDAKKNVDLAKLPPPRRCLREHIKRTNYQVAIWKRANIAICDVPEANEEDNGWMLVNGKLEPCWCEGEILPMRIADILFENMKEDIFEDDEEDYEVSEEEGEGVSESEDDD
ncbi:hypothetical protein GQR58_004701 [Nymphon striatum]|nr:hypothetical protein GQR58_004701 [Nymphon striatum]